MQRLHGVSEHEETTRGRVNDETKMKYFKDKPLLLNDKLFNSNWNDDDEIKSYPNYFKHQDAVRCLCVSNGSLPGQKHLSSTTPSECGELKRESKRHCMIDGTARLESCVKYSELKSRFGYISVGESFKEKTSDKVNTLHNDVIIPTCLPEVLDGAGHDGIMPVDNDGADGYWNAKVSSKLSDTPRVSDPDKDVPPTKVQSPRCESSSCSSVRSSNFSSSMEDNKSVQFRVRESDGEALFLEQNGVTLTLLNSSLWKAFSRVGTEMIINRGGRRMFPYLSLSVTGLQANAMYTVSLQIVPASPRRCKYINSKWIPVGLADTEPAQAPSFHLDSPSAGQHWNRLKINFPKIKLTNNKESPPHNILLHSMHKYKIITTFTLVDPAEAEDQPEGMSSRSLSFHFPETDFIAVTAYQNDSVTQMKIHNNPFAKAFRDSNFTEIRRNIASRKRKHTEMQKAAAAAATRPSSSALTGGCPASALALPDDKPAVLRQAIQSVTLPTPPEPGASYPWTILSSQAECLIPQGHPVRYFTPWMAGPAGYAGSIFPSLLPTVSPLSVHPETSMTCLVRTRHPWPPVVPGPRPPLLPGHFEGRGLLTREDDSE